MKLLFENWRGYLNEVGEGSAKPYSYVPPKIYDNYGEELLRDGDRVQYEFTTDGGYEYTVQFSRGIGFLKSPGWEIEYYYDHFRGEDVGRVGETGEGQPLKIMSTVLSIIKDFISKPKLNQGLKTYGFTGVEKTSVDDEEYEERQPDETTRTKLYMRYLKKHMPEGTVVKQDGDDIRFTLPDDTPSK